MFSLKVFGAKEVSKNLKKGVGGAVLNALKKLTFKVEAFAKKSTVVATGRLRSSIASKIGKDSSVVETNVEYAEFVEYGTVKMEARHMEGGIKVLGQGMFGYTEEKMGGEIKEFEQQVLKDIKKRITG